MYQEFKVDGFDELFAKMDKLAEEIGQGKTDSIWRRVLGYAFEPVLTTAKTLAPHESPESTGALKDGIYMKVQRPQARDKNSASYKGETFMARVTASPIRPDTVRKTVLNKRGKFQSTYANLRPVALSQEFGNQHLVNSEFGTAAKGAHPFLRPALERHIQDIQDRLGIAVNREIEEMVSK